MPDAIQTADISSAANSLTLVMTSSNRTIDPTKKTRGDVPPAQPLLFFWYARCDSNARHMASEAIALSS